MAVFANWPAPETQPQDLNRSGGAKNAAAASVNICLSCFLHKFLCFYLRSSCTQGQEEQRCFSYTAYRVASSSNVWSLDCGRKPGVVYKHTPQKHQKNWATSDPSDPNPASAVHANAAAEVWRLTRVPAAPAASCTSGRICKCRPTEMNSPITAVALGFICENTRTIGCLTHQRARH